VLPKGAGLVKSENTLELTMSPSPNLLSILSIEYSCSRGGRGFGSSLSFLKV
jgi:hypothetical protein